MNFHRLLWVGCLFTVTAFAQAPANLVPNPEFHIDESGKAIAWQLWSPRPDLQPRADVVKMGSATALRLTAVDFSSFGKWLVKDIPVSSGHFYRFEVLYEPEGIVNERGSVGVMLSWNGSDGQPVQRDYVDQISSADNGWRRAARTLRVPEKASSVTIELWLRWTAAGSVSFREPSLVETSEPAQRKVRVVTTRIPVRWNTTIEANMKVMADVLDEAGRERPDVILLTEFFPERGVKGTAHDRSEPIPGPVTDVLARKAREYNSYIITGMLELDGGKTYDTAVLIDRQGRIAGKYRKTHLPLAEVEDGETPGSEYPVFDTDFGRIGILICWDASFPETMRIMRLKGAEIVFLPIAGYPSARQYDTITRARALDNGIYLVASVSEGAASRIVNPDGEVVAETTDGLATADLDLAREWRLWWLSVGPAYGEAKSLVIQERRPDTYQELVDGSACCRTVAAGERLPSQAEVLALMRKVNDWQLAHPMMAPDDPNWFRATWYTGVMSAWKETHDAAFLNQALAWGQQQGWQVGTEPEGPNRLICVETWLELFFVKNDRAMIEPTIQWLSTKEPNSPGGAKRWYLDAYDPVEVYADSLYGASALAMLAKATGERKYLDIMQAFFDDVTSELLDQESGLYYRDPRFIGRKTANGKKILWSRGNGWVFAGIARILEYLPKDDPSRPEYERIFRRMAAELVKRQGADGLWRPNLDDPEDVPEPETSGSGFFCYGLAWGINHGVLERSAYLPAVINAWAGLSRNISPEGRPLRGQQVDFQPNAVKQDSTPAFVTGTFLLAGSQVYALSATK